MYPIQLTLCSDVRCTGVLPALPIHRGTRPNVYLFFLNCPILSQFFRYGFTHRFRNLTLSSKWRKTPEPKNYVCSKAKLKNRFVSKLPHALVLVCALVSLQIRTIIFFSFFFFSFLHFFIFFGRRRRKNWIKKTQPHSAFGFWQQSSFETNYFF